MYNAYITEIKNVRKHGNADRLNVGECFGNQVIVSLETSSGQLGVYFPSDGQLSVEYCQANNLVRVKDEFGNNVGGYLEPDKRNIRAIKLRGEVSDGLFMPLESLVSFTDISKLKQGDLVTVLGGVEICKKYVPIKNEINPQRLATKLKNKANKVQFPNFKEHIDTSQLMYNLHQFKVGDICYITLKMHGTSGRTTHGLKTTKIVLSGIRKLIAKALKKPTEKITLIWEYVSGTRRVVLEHYDGGFYGSNQFRVKRHNEFVGKLYKGETVYYEIVGFEPSGRAIMGSVSNSKTQDKEFIKKYGETTTYSYGCEVGENDMYVYRMSMTNEEGHEVDYPWDMVQTRCEQIGVKSVMEFDRFIFTTEEDLLERVGKYVDGVDPVGLTHVREGIVVRVEGKEKFKAFKHKNFHFKCLEGIIKDAGIVDMEEQESIEEGE